jgi:O-acetyl-ADP-ribose deacetylase (regulator of RNase III)
MTATIEIVDADITALALDAIVNAANSELLRGGGVCGAIHAAAGAGLTAECAGLGGCPTGDARLTGGHGLAAKNVIHAVGPYWQGGDRGEAGLLASCYLACFDLADEYELTSIAFPAISTGIFGYPLEAATKIALRQADAYRSRGNGTLERIVFCCFGDAVTGCYQRIHSQLGA